MSERQAVKWVVPIANDRKDLLKSIALFTDTPMCEIVDTAIKEYIERLQEGDYKKNLENMKAKRKDYLKLKKALDKLQKMRSEYSARIKELGIESTEEILSEYLDL